MAMEVLAVGPVGVYKHTGGHKMLSYAVSRVLCRPNVLIMGSFVREQETTKVYHYCLLSSLPPLQTREESQTLFPIGGASIIVT